MMKEQAKVSPSRRPLATPPPSMPRANLWPETQTGVDIKSIRSRFEKAGNVRQTPESFLMQQKLAAEQEAAAVLLARKKAAAFNMAMRQHELAASVQKTIAKMPKEDKDTREKLRQEARRVSHVLRNIDDSPSQSRPMADGQQRRATQLVLASMAEELEQELKREEELAKQREKEARQAELAAKEAEAKLEAQRQALEQARIAARAREEAEAAAMASLKAKEEALREEERIVSEERAAAEAAKRAESEAAAAAKAAAKRVEDERLEAHKAAVATAPVSAETYKPPPKADNSKDRAILTSYLRENYPEKLDQVDALLEQFSGNLDVLFEELAKDQKFDEADDIGDATDAATFKEEDVAASAVPTATLVGSKSFLKPGVDLRLVVASFYQIYAPSKINDVDDILKHFADRESDLFRTLEVKYDVEFSRDGSCRPLDADKVGEPFLEASQSFRQESSKFAVDVGAATLKERLKKQGASPEKLSAVMSSGSGMM